MTESDYSSSMLPGEHAGASRRAVVVTQLTLSVLGLTALAYSWFFIWRYFSSPAWFDLWYWVEDFEKWTRGHYGFHDLIRPQSEHRIATTRLLLLIDSLYFGMSGHFVALINSAAFLLFGLLLGRLAMSGVSRDAAWHVPAVVWAAFVSGTCQVNNLTLAFQVQFALTCCFALGATWLFANACEPLPRRYAHIANAACGVVFALLAIFSMGSGILLLPALGLVLWLRRAPSAVWAIFLIWAVAALVLEMESHIGMQEMALSLSPGMLALHVMFSAKFMGSAMNELPELAPWIGLAVFSMMLALGAGPVWRRLRGGPALPAADATLLALALFAAMCGPAASLTLRIVFGSDSALAPRYATISLLLWATCAGLLLRRINGAGPGNIWGRTAVILSTAGLLYLMNLPSYAVLAESRKRTILAEAGLLTNNIGVAGPIDVIFFAGVAGIRNSVRFLHQTGLNMFAAAQGPPLDMLARLSAAPVGSLPACQGSVDWAMAIDSGAVLLNGWLADPDGRHTAPWIVARDEAGRVFGTARALEDRVDLDKAAGFKAPSYGFTAGFRDGLDGPRRLRLAGIFPDRMVKLCELSAAVEISGVVVQPISELRDLRIAPSIGAAAINSGFAAGLGSAPAGAPGFALAAPAFSAGGAPGHVGAVDFVAAGGAPPNAALVLPFWTPTVVGWKSVTFVLGDGTRLSAPLGPWWGRGFWRGAVLPTALAQLHGGAVRVEVRDAGSGELTVAAPMLAEERPGWSRLF
jgi:hypothetical protein